MLTDNSGDLWDTLLQQLQSDSLVGAPYAASLFRQFPAAVRTDQRLRTLLSPFEKSSGSMQTALLDTLVSGSEELATIAVNIAMVSQEENVQMTALEAIEGALQPQHMKLLANVAGNSRGRVRDKARQLLYKRQAEYDGEILRQLPLASEVGPRSELLRCIGMRQISATQGLLYQFTNDASARVRAASLGAFTHVGAQTDIVPLSRVLIIEKNRSAQRAGEDTLVQLIQRLGSPHSQDQQLKAIGPLLQQSDPAARTPLLRVCAKIGGARAQSLLQSNLRSEDSAAKTAALRASMDWRGLELHDCLADVAKSSDPSQHALAIRAMVEIVRSSAGLYPSEVFLAYKRALQLSQRNEERKLILGVLSTVPQPAALALARRHLEMPKLRTEAALAVSTLARSLASQEPELARSAIQEIRQVAPTPALMQQTDRTLEMLDQYQGFIGTWLVCGPFEGKSAPELFRAVLPPETEAGATWRTLPADSLENPWLVDLTPLDRSDNRCAYLRAEIYSDKAQQAQIELGSDDCIKVWLNGKEVHANDAMRAMKPASDVVEIHLEAGWNPLLLKVVQGGGGWGACCAIRSLNGGPIENLRFRAE